ncbi:MAG: hypothetical protein P9L91_07765, partial [Candidatus Zophobacter franzmannii]|nr:hypothetical protein [Candidatus Zophobacter franzmannii]
MHRIIIIIVSVVLVFIIYKVSSPEQPKVNQITDFYYECDFPYILSESMAREAAVRKACYELIKREYGNEFMEKVVYKNGLDSEDIDYAKDVPNLLAGLYTNGWVVKDFSSQQIVESNSHTSYPGTDLLRQRSVRTQRRPFERITTNHITTTSLLLDTELRPVDSNPYGLVADIESNLVPVGKGLTITYST